MIVSPLSHIVAQRLSGNKVISITKAKEPNFQLAARPNRPEKLGGLVRLYGVAPLDNKT